MTSHPTILGNGGQPNTAVLLSYSYLSNRFSCAGVGSQSAMVQPSIAYNPRSVGFTVEGQTSQKIHADGAVSHLAFGIQDEPWGDTFTFSLRQNASGVLAVTFGATDTGWMTDTSSATVASGDLLDFEADIGTGNSAYTGNFNCASASFTASTNSVQLLSASGPFSLAPNSSHPAHMVGVFEVQTSETNTQFCALTAANWQYLSVQVESNSFELSATVISRIGGTNGHMSVVIPTGFTSGNIEDTSHVDTVAATDLLNYYLSTSATTSPGCKIDYIGCHYLAATTSNCILGGMPGGPETIPYSATNYSALFGSGILETNISDTDFATGKFPYNATVKNYSANIMAGEGTCTLVINGSVSGTPLAITATGSTSGWVTDVSDTASVLAGNSCANRVAGNGSSGSIQWNGGGLVVTAS